MRSVRSLVAGLFAMFIGSTVWAAACDGFTDVDSANTTFCSAVSYLATKGITLGCTGTTYCPNDYVTRLQMALFLQRNGRQNASNSIGDTTNAISGGTNNASGTDGSQYNTLAGGFVNSAGGAGSVVSGGASNTASGFSSTVAGGERNIASGSYSVVAAGDTNIASGTDSFAAGTKANANRDGCFVWGDTSTDNDVRCQQPNRFIVRSTGGVFMITGGIDQDSYTGAQLLAGASSWTTVSDRASKDNLRAVDPSVVLRNVVTMPIATWNWKSQDASIRHMGPMAQDFAAAFNLGETSRGINTVDVDGVALAAIQGLHQMLLARDSVIADQAHELASLATQLAAIADQLQRVEARLR